MAERMTVWYCIGCGRIEGPQPCIGVCQDRKLDLVRASDHDAAQAQVEALGALVRQLASVTPREGAWESSYRALQAQARETLEALAAASPPAG